MVGRQDSRGGKLSAYNPPAQSNASALDVGQDCKQVDTRKWERGARKSVRVQGMWEVVLGEAMCMQGQTDKRS